MKVYQPKYTGRDGKTYKSAVWWVDYSIGGRRVRESTNLRDVNAAHVRASEMVRAAELRAAGIETHDATRGAKVADVLADYIREIRRRGKSERYAADTDKRLRRLLEGVADLASLTPERIRSLLGRLTESEALSPKTSNYYRVAVFGLFAWLVREGRWPSNPVAAVSRAKEGESSRPRRALSADELSRLLAASPPARSLGYRLAATTGLRRSELAALRWSDVDLDGATVTIRASAAKNRREAVLPLSAGTVAALRAFRGRAPASASIFAGPLSTKHLRRDMAAAGLARVERLDVTEPGAKRKRHRQVIHLEDESGRVADVHALRVYFATSLARAGVPLVQAQVLMRHSDPRLTANVYTRLDLADARTAVAKVDLPFAAGATPTLPLALPSTDRTVQDAAGTGTNGAEGQTAAGAARTAPIPSISRQGRMEAPRGIEPRYTDLQSVA